MNPARPGVNQRIMRKIPKPDPILTADNLQTLFLNPGEPARFSFEDEIEWLILPDRPYGTGRSLYPIKSLRSVISYGSDLDGETVSALLRHKVPVAIFSDRGQLLGRIEPALPLRSQLIRAQVTLDDSQRLHLSQRIVWGSLRQRRRFILRFCREQSEDRQSAQGVIQSLDWAIDAVTRKDSVASVVGCLGSGLSAYYKHFPLLLRQPGWSWQGRSNPSPLNTLLDYSYSLIDQTLITALAHEGLDVHAGIWRKPSDRNPLGLVHDLATEFRQFADAIVLRAINRRQIVPVDFDEWRVEDGGLPPLVRATLTVEYQKKMEETFMIPHTSLQVSYQEMMAFQCRQLAMYLAGEITEYCPVSVK